MKNNDDCTGQREYVNIGTAHVIFQLFQNHGSLQYSSTQFAAANYGKYSRHATRRNRSLQVLNYDALQVFRFHLCT